MKESMTYFLRIYLEFYLISPDSGSYVGAAVGVDNLKGIDDTLGVIIYDNFEPTGIISEPRQIPSEFILEQNYPNPFNPSTMIKFSLAADSRVTLTVFDILGQEVANLISGNLAAGSHEFNFDASNLNSGVYFYRINAAGVDGTNFTSVKKMILTK
ncbi:hypothetical protein BMS3Abin03_00423 [bacterium BMS3Abin03]|nr:hypothetical protein BMS3Abin03_00423 [bacterium BMS3Abin03]